MSSEKRSQPQVKQEPDAGKRIKVEASSSALPAAEGSVGAAGQQPSSQQPAAASSTTASASQPAAASIAPAVTARLPGLLILSAEDVQRCLARMSAQDICKGQEDVFRKIWQLTWDRQLIVDYKRKGLHHMVEHEMPPLQRSTAECQNPQRLAVDLRDHTALFMPARLGERTACKIVGVPKPAETSAAGGGGAVAEAGIPGSTVLLDPLTAKVKAIVDSTVLTALRTAAGSAIATQQTHPVDSLERKEALRLVIFGGGRQAYYHAWMLQRVYQLPKRPKLPQIGQITFVTRRPLTQTALPQLARELQEGQPRAGDPDGVVRIGDIVAEGVTSSDETAVARLMGRANIVCCCTPSTKPLFRFADLKKGAHVNLVGSCKWAARPRTAARCEGSQSFLLCSHRHRPQHRQASHARS